jgi:cytochrome c-type biogenesis protein
MGIKWQLFLLILRSPGLKGFFFTGSFIIGLSVTFAFPGLFAAYFARVFARIGMIFGLIASPCATPVLTVIITYAAVQADTFHGSGLIAVCRLRCGLPLLTAVPFAGWPGTYGSLINIGIICA